MRILVVAATREEVKDLIYDLRFTVYDSQQGNRQAIQTNSEYNILITGVGMVATAFALGRHLVNNGYDLAINLGIAGSFDRNIALGDVLVVTEDTFAELGAEDDDNFLRISQLGFGEDTYYPIYSIANVGEFSSILNLKVAQATAITVNTVHGNEGSIKKVIERLNPQLESMEGAAFFYACQQFGIPSLQIRAVSNYVEKRNRDNWQIGLAIKNLNTFAVEFLKLLQKGQRRMKITKVSLKAPAIHTPPFTMKLTLGFSPCPNDTFIFDALIHHKIDTEGLDFEVYYDDVETLNQKAMRGELDITKLSYHAFAYVADKYILLDAGSALGFGVGPMLICKDDPERLRQQLTTHNSQLTIGIPGKYTTANFLLGLAFPNATNKVELVFSDIENAVLDGRVDIGLIIHENRFTYQDKGLKKIIDLGDYWEKQTGCAIPLGGIVVNRNLPIEIQHKINRVLRRSVEFAFANPKSGLEYIRSHAQEMSEEVMYKHIDLYVNKYSVDLGAEGKKAIKLLFDTALEKGIIPEIKENIFLTADS